MLKYSRYLVFNFFKRVGVYITIFAFAVIVSGFLMAQILNNNANLSSLPISEMTPVITRAPDFTFLFFPFLFVTMFLVLIVIHVFKEGQKDGTELLIVSKPLSRTTIIFSKFFSSIFLLLIWNILSFVIYFINAYFDDFATNIEKIVYAGSLSLGGFIIGLIVLSILVLFSTFMGRIGISVVSICFAAILPISSVIATTFTNAIPPYENVENQEKYLISSKPWTKENMEKNNENKFYFDDLSWESEKDKNDDGSTYEQSRWNDYINGRNYGNIVYFDFWYQWSRFYSIFFEDENVPLELTPQKLARSETQMKNIPNDQYITLPNENKYFVFRDASEININNEKRYEEDRTDSFKYDSSRREGFKKFLEKALNPDSSFDNDWQKLFKNAINDFFGENDFELSLNLYSNKDWKPIPITLKNDNLQDTLMFLQIMQELNEEFVSMKNENPTSLPSLNSNSLEEYLNDDENITINFGRSWNSNNALVSKNTFWAYKDVIENKFDKNIDNFQNFKNYEVLNYKNIFNLNEKIPVFEVKPWLSTNMVVIAWSAISLLILSLAIFMYLRKDFK